MSVIYVLVPVATLLVVAAVWAFVRAVRGGQFDDLDTPALRMLHDDTPAPRAEGAVGGGTATPGDGRGPDEPAEGR